MDIVNLWQQQVSKWNDEKKCGFCWNFSAPLVESAVNIHQLQDPTKCCLQIFLTNLSMQENTIYRQDNPQWVDKSYTEWTFTLYALFPSHLGTNNYTEIEGYPVDESNWHTIYSKISECFQSTEITNFCQVLGHPLQVLRKRGEIVHNYLDLNYNGWKYTITIRENRED